MNRNGLVRAIVAMTIIVIIPYVVISAGDQGPRGSTWVLCTLVALYAGWKLTQLITRAVPRLYEFIFWLFCYLFMGIAPATQLRTNDMPNTTPNVLPGNDLVTGLIVVLGIIGFELGVLSERLRRRHDEPATTGDGEVVVEERNAMITRILPLLGVSFLASAYVIRGVGLAAFFGSREERANLSAAVLPDATIGIILQHLSWVPALVVVQRIVIAARLPDGGRRRFTMLERVCVGVAAVLILISNNPLSSARYVFGAMAFSIVVLFGAFRTSSRTRWTFIGILVALFILFPFANSFRLEGSETKSISLTNEYRGNGDYDAFAQIHNSITIVDNEGYSYLQQPLGVALFWVPRGMWPDKPEDTGIFIAKHRGYSFTNLSAPPWSELYLVGGAVPVFLGFVVIGKWLRRADSRLLARFEARRPLSVVEAFMPFYLMIFLRGSLLQAMALCAIFLGSVRFTRPYTSVLPVSHPAVAHTVGAR